jgi:hypothetical protein
MITIESNILQVVNNFEKQVREQPLIVKKSLGRTAEFLMFLIKKRTARGKDFNGMDFAKYTPEYRKIRGEKQLPLKPDLFFSGKMLSNMTQKSTPSYAQVYFSSIREGLKAMGNQRKRKFFAIGDAEAPLLKNKFMEEYNKLSKL